MHRNLVRDAVYGILHHCEQQRDGRYDRRRPMAQTGQIPDPIAEGLISLGMQLLEAALAQNNYNIPQADNEADVLDAATKAYQRGHITKQQFFAVINALDEMPPVQTSAYRVNSDAITRR